MSLRSLLLLPKDIQFIRLKPICFNLYLIYILYIQLTKSHPNQSPHRAQQMIE